MEESRAGVYIADHQGNLIYVNSAFVAILGYSLKEELIGKNLAKELYVNPKEREPFLNTLVKMGFVRDYEVRNKRKDGSIAILSVTSNWIKDETEQVIGVEGIVHDITEKKKIEEAFKDEEDKLNQVLRFEEGLSLIHDVERLGQFAVRQISGILNAQKCSLMLYNHEKEDLFILSAQGMEEAIIEHANKKIGEPIAGMVAQKREPYLVSNIEYDKQLQLPNRPHYATRSFMSVPVLFGPKLLGVINVADKFLTTWETFTELDLKMLCTMARAVGIALENARLFQRLEDLAAGEPWASLRHRY
ncbi:MAG: PAS domain S-box protein [Candidatus Omnitrophica bacterium]|nr:PAS domain S-box protein [Candidatus Omnitrophota bacterium]